ncbi:MAG: DUF3987 domain-containing protein [Bacteroidales bacterium]|nr:DUF3987 domain-containing protein [Bacteroidales bacterium]
MNNQSLDDLRHLTEAVCAAGADIAPTYREYVQLAFAIATDCGEAGRADFHTLCSISSKYDAQNADLLFDSALRTHKGDVHLGTAFHLAQCCGVGVHPPAESGSTPDEKSAKVQKSAVPFSHTRARDKKYEGMKNEELRMQNDYDDAFDGDEQLSKEGPEPYVPLPTFRQDYVWPDLLNRIVSYGERPEQRDVLLLGGLTVLGASLSHTVRCLYSRKWQSPCMQTFVVAPSGTGKSALTWVRLLVEPLHKRIRTQTAEAMKEYRRKKAEYDTLGKERSKQEPPVAPPNKMFLISGNNSGTGILQNLIDSDGRGIICESEADTVSAAIGTDYGNWSDTLRKAFDHDRLSYNRRTDREYREVEKSYLSVLLSGTPAQVKPLIPSPENGLFSRQNFYYMPHVRSWSDQFAEDETDVEEEFRRMGHEWCDRLEELRRQGVFSLRLTKEQKAEFNCYFKDLFHRSGMTNGDEMNGSVVRLAINVCRVMSVVALLRSLEVPSLSVPDTGQAKDNLKDGIITRWQLSITDEDFRAVLSLAEPLYLHATHILSFLTPVEVTSRSIADKNMLFAAMDTEFTRKQLLAKAEEMGIPKETAASWLGRLLQRGALAKTDERGKYRKETK